MIIQEKLFVKHVELCCQKEVKQVVPNGDQFANDGVDKSRTGTGTSITMHDMGLSTVIGAVNKDATGKPLSSAMKQSFDRIRTWDSKITASFIY